MMLENTNGDPILQVQPQELLEHPQPDVVMRAREKVGEKKWRSRGKYIVGHDTVSYSEQAARF
jgi:hypothetical protein